MHLLNTSTRKLQEFAGPQGLQYVVLSHRWTEEEVTFEDIKDLTSCHKKGLSKITSFCQVALELGFEWCWIDTCCINKASLTELSEAINSMFAWYQQSAVCIIYLHDVSSREPESPEAEAEIRASDWFLRSWTLQELLASARNKTFYYGASWQLLGTRESRAELVSDITTIDKAAILGTRPLSDYCVAERMAWASMRSATRVEDIAYSLLGIFDIQMPLIYGEGRKSFRRLQDAIMLRTDDETIFAWEPTLKQETGLLAPWPSVFAGSRSLQRYMTSRKSYELLGRGVRFDAARYFNLGEAVVVLLNVGRRHADGGTERIGIYLLERLDESGYERVWVTPEEQLWRGPAHGSRKGKISEQPFYIPFNHEKPREYDLEALHLDQQGVIPSVDHGFDLNFVPPAMLHLAPDSKLRFDNGLLTLEKGGPLCNVIVKRWNAGIYLIHLGLDNDGRMPVCGIAAYIDHSTDSNPQLTDVSNSIRDFTMDYTRVNPIERQMLPDRNGKHWSIPVMHPEVHRDLLGNDKPMWYQPKPWQHPKEQPDLNYFWPLPFDPLSVDTITNKCRGWGVELLSVGSGRWRFGLASYSIISTGKRNSFGESSRARTILNFELPTQSSSSAIAGDLLGEKFPEPILAPKWEIDLDTFKSLKEFPDAIEEPQRKQMPKQVPKRSWLHKLRAL